MRALTLSLMLISNSSFAGVIDTFTESLGEHVNKLYDAEQQAHVDQEVSEAREALAAGHQAPVCGKKSTGVDASTSLRRILKSLRSEFQFSVSTPSPTGTAQVCVTLTP